MVNDTKRVNAVTFPVTTPARHSSAKCWDEASFLFFTVKHFSFQSVLSYCVSRHVHCSCKHHRVWRRLQKQPTKATVTVVLCLEMNSGGWDGFYTMYEQNTEDNTIKKKKNTFPCSPAFPVWSVFTYVTYLSFICIKSTLYLRVLSQEAEPITSRLMEGKPYVRAVAHGRQRRRG